MKDMKTMKLDMDGDGILTVTIDLPDASMNVVDDAFLKDLASLIRELESNDGIRGAVMISGKPAFMAGADLRMLAKLSGEARNAPMADVVEAAHRYSGLLRELELCEKPLVAAVHGLALGGGLEFALACHTRIASNDRSTKFGFPEVMVGLLPGAGGLQRMLRLSGMQATLQYATTGKTLTAQEAVGLNLFHELAEPDDLLATAKKRILEKPVKKQPWDARGFRIPGGGGAMHPKAVQTMIGANAMAQDKSMHNYPAIPYILSGVYEGGIVPFDTAIKLDSKRFAMLLKGVVAPNMIRSLFVNKQRAEKLEKRPKGPEKHEVKTLGVLGAGMMGSGIAYVSAAAGMKVILLDRELSAAEKGKAHAEKLVGKAVSRARMTKDKGKALLDNIVPTTDFSDLKDADLVIEAVFEDRAIKADVTKKTEAAIGKDIIFASNTSTLPITGLARASKRPDQFIGIHFFSPVEKMQLVEVILGEKTEEKAIAIALDYVRQIRKLPIVVNDSRGFYTSRCFGTYVTEGMAMLGEGVSPALIENAGRMAGMPVGPLAVGDEVSIELSYKIMQQTKSDMGGDYTPHPADAIVEKFVKDLGRMGRKNGKGVYEYPEEGRKYLWPGLADYFPLADKQPTVAEVEERLIARQVIEVIRCFEEGVLNDPESADLGAIFGWGFAPFTGGPLSYVDTMGAGAFLKTAERLAKAHGERFEPPKLLRDMAKKESRFYRQAA